MANSLFYLMAAGAVASAVGVVAAKNPVMSVLSLLASFFCLAVIYLLAGFQFLAAAQVLVYAGAIMVLFLFVIMLLNLGGLSRARWIDAEVLRARRMPLIATVAAGLFLAAGIATAAQRSVRAAEGAAGAGPTGPIDSARELAALLFGRFLLPFEASAVLLAAAAVAVLVLAKRQRGPADHAGGAEGSGGA